jgi:hypothetical protein
MPSVTRTRAEDLSSFSGLATLDRPLQLRASPNGGARPITVAVGVVPVMVGRAGSTLRRAGGGFVPHSWRSRRAVTIGGCGQQGSSRAAHRLRMSWARADRAVGDRAQAGAV